MMDDEREAESPGPEATPRDKEPKDGPAPDGSPPEAGGEESGAAAPDADEPAPLGTEPAGREASPEEPTLIGPLGPASPEQEREPTIAAISGRVQPSGAAASPDSTIYAGRAGPTAPRPDAAVGGLSTTIGNFAPRTDSRPIRVGDVLNNSYQVTRFIARGGMGEVFEGVNVLSEERVAIKVILPSLAADVNVIELFKKEAQTLIKLAHDALVKYRQISQSKELGVIYLVTEFIDGTNLADVLGSVKPTDGELVDLLRRLASGLAVAHDCGAVHRDLSPDNVILEGGSLSRPKIVDFGIAKNLDPGSKTIVGDNFAGKLNFVAPEQLGAHEGRVGPAADIYSLALTMLAVIGGRPLAMGGSLVDAVRKRETVPDLSAVPASLRPVLTKMLQPDPEDRYQTMREVVAVLSGGGGSEHDLGPRRTGPRQPGPVISRPMLIGGGAVLIAGLVALVAVTGGDGGDPAEASGRVRLAVDRAAASIPCSWLSIGEIAGSPPTVRMTGVARSLTDAGSRLDQVLTQAGVSAQVDMEDVATILPAGCSALDTFGEIRKPGMRHLAAEERSFEMSNEGSLERGKPVSLATVTFNPPPGKDFTLFGIEPEGLFSDLAASRADLDARARREALMPEPRQVSRTPSGGYVLKLWIDHVGWSGLVLIAGEGPFEPALTQPVPAARTAAWQRSFRATASERNWTSEMLWFRSVDRTPNN
ncbi:MAG TPA: protein kinase [Allosphingosinicella sp.]|jgi:serine/threonine-protein kinase